MLGTGIQCCKGHSRCRRMQSIGPPERSAEPHHFSKYVSNPTRVNMRIGIFNVPMERSGGLMEHSTTTRWNTDPI